MEYRKGLYGFTEDGQWTLPGAVWITILALCLLSFGVRYFITGTSPIVMDEFVDIQLACQVARGHDLYSEGGYYFRTPLMIHTLSWLCDGTSDSFATVLNARKLMWLFSAVTAFLVFMISRRVFGTAVALLSLLLLCSFTTFLDRSLHVRADMVATLFYACALYLSTFNAGWIFFFVGVALGLAFMTTQKAVYVVAAFAVALLFRHAIGCGSLRSFFGKSLQRGLVSALGFFSVVLVYAVYFWRDGQLTNFMQQCFGSALEAGLLSDVYQGTWVYLRLSLFRNPVIWYFGALALILAIDESIRAKLHSPEQGRRYELIALLGAWGLVQLAFTITHDVKFPYFFINVAPILAICAAVPLAHVCRFVFSKSNSGSATARTLRRVCLVAIVAVLVGWPAVRHLQNLDDSLITEQKAVISRVDAITVPGDAVLDGTGMITTRRKATPFSMTARFFARREQGYDYDVIDWVRRTEPKVLIDNYRLRQLDKGELDVLRAGFLPDWRNVWVVGVSIPLEGAGREGQFFDLLASAPYAVLCNDLEKVWIDGEPAESTQFLSAGRHHIRVAGNNTPVTLKYAPAVFVPYPPGPDRAVNLFPSYRE